MHNTAPAPMLAKARTSPALNVMCDETTKNTENINNEKLSIL